MNAKEDRQLRLHDFKPGQDCFRAEVLSGLQKSPKELPSKYFYDERGSSLFERICALDEYYIPSTEAAIMETYIKEMVELLGPRVLLIEYGSGSSAKTRILLDHLHAPAAYVPFDISREQLLRVTKQLALDYPGLEVLPVCADYTRDFALRLPKRLNGRRVVYFPGSKISLKSPQFGHLKLFSGSPSSWCWPKPFIWFSWILTPSRWLIVSPLSDMLT